MRTKIPPDGALVDTHEGPVVIGYDGGPGAADALALGLGWASQLGSAALVVMVYSAPAPIGPGRVDAEWVAAQRADAERQLDEVRQKTTGSNVEFRAVASGSASHGLQDMAEELKASLLVLGPPQRAESHLLSASARGRVIAGAPCPVAIPPRGWRDRPELKLGRIGVAFVPTPDGREALRVASIFARRVGASLHVVTAVASEAEVLSSRIGEDIEHGYVATAKDEFKRAIEDAIAELGPDVEVSGEVLIGQNTVETLAGVRDNTFDALFMGSRGYGPIRRVLLGGVSARLIRQLEVPAVVVPRAG
jgi:nucleotide-binding universal stress UspA family protein